MVVARGSRPGEGRIKSELVPAVTREPKSGGVTESDGKMDVYYD